MLAIHGHGSLILAAALIALVLGALWPAVAPADQRYGHERTVFTVGAHQAFVIRPDKPAAGGAKPWAWYAPTFINENGGGYPNASNEWLFRRLLDAGWVVAGVDVGESHGSPAGRKAYGEFYDAPMKKKGPTGGTRGWNQSPIRAFPRKGSNSLGCAAGPGSRLLSRP